mmetsp:Transcript_7002/g.13919  ORF Transcript_7002/g.13919 Transcript_7002/m.13919 type:complete len:560 (-) Transcript_7002:354-2033(-)
MEHVLMAGKKNRSVGATLMNQDSSRSHSIFSIIIESSSESADGSRHIRAGKLNLVDLAGSERQSKTGATGDRLKEATKINLSLSALGNVISALVDSKTNHIPYRDSKLTRLLQDSLGGNTKTVMVANMGPADYNYDESISTLRYANRAKNIKNKPKINEDPKDAMLREFQEEISRLKALLESQGADTDGDGGIPAEGPSGGGGGGGAPKAAGLVKGMSNRQLEEANMNIAEQRAALEKAENMREEDKKRAAEEITKKEEALAKERREREALAAQLAAMEEKVVQGTADSEEARLKEEELEKAEIELEERRAEHARLNEQLREHEEMSAMVEEKYVSVQEEVIAKTKKLNKLYAKYKETQQEVKDLQHEFQMEKEDILATIREQDKEIKKLTLVMNNFIPEEERDKIEQRTCWSDVDQAWEVEHEALTGNNVRQPLANNAQGTARQPRNMPMQEEADDEMMGLAVPNMPNVYFSYPSSSSLPAFVDDQQPPKERPSSSARPKSRSSSSRGASAKRPTSARKGSKAEKDEKPSKSDLKPFQEEEDAATEDFPTAKGLVARN